MSENETTEEVSVEWCVESETLADYFDDEAHARQWLKRVTDRVAAGDPHWQPAVLKCRMVTTTYGAWIEADR